MDKTELEEYVVQALGKRKGRDEILTYVCEHGGMKWREAELFVTQVIDKHEPEITRRRKGAIIIFGIIGIIGVIIVVIGIAYATRSRPDPTLSERPLCVTLPVYSSVIEQVMDIYPTWSNLRATHDGFESTWVIEAEGATHHLTATLTKNECICATLATSRYPSGSPQAEFAGQLQGAAVAPISDLGYTTSWLEPKLLFSCTGAFLRREQYVASESMPDETVWKLECGRPADPAFADLELSLAVITQQCQVPIQ
jgi:hypothetical protein